jgi:large conductance mechanosensitive channel
MPRLDENTQQYLRDAEQGIRVKTSSWFDSFTNFALRDNVLEVAVGLMYTRLPMRPCLPYSQSCRLAAAFTACANSLVSDIILPLISLLPFLARNLDEKFAILKAGPNYNNTISTGYNTKDQALNDGAVVFAYGNFVDKLVRFFAIAITLWVIASVYSRASDDNIVKKQVKCKFCRKYISERAMRCTNCTSWQDGRETS